MPESKPCTACGEDDPSAFGTKQNGGRRPRCRKCEAEAQRVRDRADSAARVAHLEEPDPERLTSCLAWATSLEREAVTALCTHGSLVAPAEALGMSSRLLRGKFSELERRAARRGWSSAHDMKKTTPDGFHVKGVSTYYDGDGNVKGQWVKSQADGDSKLEILFDAVQALAEPFRGLSDPAPASTLHDSDLLAVYPLGDPHLGMHAWAAETGANFDLTIAERNLCGAVDHLVNIAPASREALLISLGDLFHADSARGETTRGTRVDVDTRYAKVVGLGIRVMRRLIDRLLLKHEQVRVIIEIGNHDENTSMALALFLSEFYEREPRVSVDTSPAKFHYYRFGANLIGVTHGDTCKFADLGGIMSVDRAEDWGETSSGARLWYTGHVHHERVKELHGCVAESFRTLASRDAWHAGQGYRSGQDMRVDILHRKFGRVGRHIVGINQITGG